MPSVEQARDRALRHANVLRHDKARLRQDLAAGRIELIDVLAEPPACIRAARVFEVIEDARGIGPTTIRRLNFRAASAGINLFRPVGELTPNHVQWLLGAIGLEQQCRPSRHEAA